MEPDGDPDKYIYTTEIKLLVRDKIVERLTLGCQSFFYFNIKKYQQKVGWCEYYNYICLHSNYYINETAWDIMYAFVVLADRKSAGGRSREKFCIMLTSCDDFAKQTGWTSGCFRITL